MGPRLLRGGERAEPDGDDTLDEEETAATVTDVVHALDDPEAEESASGDQEQEAGET